MQTEMKIPSVFKGELKFISCLWGDLLRLLKYAVFCHQKKQKGRKLS